jgi:hypothetical protein
MKMLLKMLKIQVKLMKKEIFFLRRRKLPKEEKQHHVLQPKKKSINFHFDIAIISTTDTPGTYDFSLLVYSDSKGRFLSKITFSIPRDSLVPELCTEVSANDLRINLRVAATK